LALYFHLLAFKTFLQLTPPIFKLRAVVTVVGSGYKPVHSMMYALLVSLPLQESFVIGPVYTHNYEIGYNSILKYELELSLIQLNINTSKRNLKKIIIEEMLMPSTKMYRQMNICIALEMQTNSFPN